MRSEVVKERGIWPGLGRPLGAHSDLVPRREMPGRAWDVEAAASSALRRSSAEAALAHYAQVNVAIWPAMIHGASSAAVVGRHAYEL